MIVVPSSTKSVTIVSSRPLKEVVVEITPQDTAAAILEKAGLDPRDILMKPGDQADFAPTDLPFDIVPDQGKLHVVPHSIVGMSYAPVQARHATPKTYADELGWQSKPSVGGIVHSGRFRAASLRYLGWVLQETSGKFQFFIHKPPIALLRDTNFGGCFHFRNDDWWLVAFKPHALPADLDSGIVAIQKALQSAFTTRMRNRNIHA